MERSKSYPGLNYSNLYGQQEWSEEERDKAYRFNGGHVEECVEVKRRRRVATYNKFAAEGKLKSSLKNSFKWIKSKFVDTYYDD